MILFTSLSKSRVAIALSLATLGWASQSFATTDPPQNFDFAKINKNLAEVSREASLANPIVTKLLIQLDPRGTNLSRDLLERNTVTLTLARTPWSKEAVQYRSSSSYRVTRAEKGETGALEMASIAGVRTDSVALLKYMVKTKWANCSGNANVTGVEKIFFKHGCAAAKEIIEANDLKAIAESIQRHNAAASQDLTAFVNSARAELSQSQNEVLHAEGQRLIDRVSKKIAEINSLKIREVRNGFLVQSGPIQIAHGLEVKGVRMAFAQGGAAMAIRVKAPLNLKVYDATKPEFENLLKGMEQGNAYAMEKARAKTRVMTRLLDEFASGRMTPAFLSPAGEGENQRLLGIFLGALLADGVT